MHRKTSEFFQTTKPWQSWMMILHTQKKNILRQWHTARKSLISAIWKFHEFLGWGKRCWQVGKWVGLAWTNISPTKAQKSKNPWKLRWPENRKSPKFSIGNTEIHRLPSWWMVPSSFVSFDSAHFQLGTNQTWILLRQPVKPQRNRKILINYN